MMTSGIKEHLGMMYRVEGGEEITHVDTRDQAKYKDSELKRMKRKNLLYLVVDLMLFLTTAIVLKTRYSVIHGCTIHFDFMIICICVISGLSLLLDLYGMYLISKKMAM